MRYEFWLLSSALMLSGCVSLDPHYQRPALPVVANWPKGQSYPAASPAALNASDIPWRNVMVNTNLQRVIEMALTSNRDLRKALADIEAARAQYGIQRAEQYPSLTAGVDGTRSRSLTSGSNSTTELSSSYNADLSVSSFELDLFGKNRSLTGEKLEAYLSETETAKSTWLTLISDTASAYIALATDLSNLALAQETVISARKSMEVTSSRQRNGVASGVDVAEAETTYQQARSDVASYMTSVAQDKNALVLLVGQPVPETLLPQNLASLATAIKPVAAGISSDVLFQRPDVLAAEHTLKSANASIGAARAAFFPSISLTASNGLSSGELSSLFSGGAHVWSFAPSISLPIFDGGSNLSSLRYAEAEKKGYIASYEKTIQSAFEDVANALARKGTIDEQLAAQRAYVASAQRSYQLASDRYREGVDTYLNALDAQRTLYTARKSLISTEQTRLDNLVTLYNALGGGVKAEYGVKAE
ncbi:efflux transporter outer membrane subunit [Pectobacteriaceae bacterium CE70]|nr:efflux transporter outer membrane subunit [Pectobacteriaceae bacterium C52]WJV65534.1 efflux transporter outer membrane subunit [Pectobacteriaceae bacterium CE70]WJY09553.1 efflux transporter outer membrane subunit [Pectobacteriaceae bacterium C80]